VVHIFLYYTVLPEECGNWVMKCWNHAAEHFSCSIYNVADAYYTYKTLVHISDVAHTLVGCVAIETLCIKLV
jgi:hypothetical protein